MIDLWSTSVTMLHTVYLLKSLKSSRSYVGYTSQEVNKRLLEHNSGSNRSTKTHVPYKLIYYESFVCKTDALRREKFLKSGQGSRIKKLILNNFI